MVSGMRALVPAMIAAALLSSCGSESKKSEAEAARPARAEVKPPEDESRRFPKTNLVGTEVQAEHLMGKSFMPGGTIAKYKRGNTEYQLFVAKAPSGTDAAIALSDWRKALTGAKLVPSFGGYFGRDGGQPVFVFTKGAWIAGVRGLSEKEADLPARLLAAQLPQ